MAGDKVDNSLLEELRAALTHSDNRVQIAEKVLAQIGHQINPEYIPHLLRFLDDRDDSDEIMFSLIHLVEIFPDEIYVAKVLPVFGSISQSAPNWAQIVLMRILNADSTRKIFTDQYNELDYERKRQIGNALQALSNWRPEFKGRVEEILRSVAP